MFRYAQAYEKRRCGVWDSISVAKRSVGPKNFLFADFEYQRTHRPKGDVGYGIRTHVSTKLYGPEPHPFDRSGNPTVSVSERGVDGPTDA